MPQNSYILVLTIISKGQGKPVTANPHLSPWQVNI